MPLYKGLTLGKYAPLHRGHQLVIDTALAEVDRLTVIIYDAPQVTGIPLEVRANWLRQLYPRIEVIEAHGGPAEVGYSPAVMQAHERFIIDKLAIRDVTHFYSSEPYGEHVSRALGAIDRRVDQARAQVPLSGSEIRADTYRHRHLIDPLVYRDLITNVVFVGAPSTGKTTIAERLALLFDTCWMPEYGREYWHRYQHKRRLTPPQLLDLAREHLKREESLLLRANRHLFTDTNATTTATFSRYYHGEVSKALEAVVRRAQNRYALTFLCDVDIPCEVSWDRSGPFKRERLQSMVIEDLQARGIPFIRLGGDLHKRVQRVREVLREHGDCWVRPYCQARRSSENVGG